MTYDSGQYCYEVLCLTAWNIPMKFIEWCEEKGYDIKVAYYECGMGFYGVYEHGHRDEHTVTEDDFKKTYIDPNDDDSVSYEPAGKLLEHVSKYGVYTDSF